MLQIPHLKRQWLKGIRLSLVFWEGYLGIGSEHPRVVDRLEIIRKPQLSVLYSVRPGPFVDLKLPMGTLEGRKETERRREREIETDELTDF